MESQDVELSTAATLESALHIHELWLPDPAGSTALGAHSLLHQLSVPSDELWKMALSFSLDTHQQADIQEALLSWDSDPTELRLRKTIAQFTVPSPRLRSFPYCPDVAIQAGDIGVIDHHDMQWHTLKSSGSKSWPNVDIKTWSGGTLVEHSVQLGREWHSYPIGVWKRQQYYKINISLSIGNEMATNRSMWLSLKRSSEVFPGWLEIVIGVSLTSTVSYNSDESGEIEILQHPNLYFHRQPTSPVLREFWGFFSLDANPTAPTGLKSRETSCEIRLKTLSMEDDPEEEFTRWLDQKLSKIPGSFPDA